jgi:threonine/homoserine/homoserine lactone efflux protein
MPIETWLLFMLVAILPAMSPGPAVLLVISNALRFGAGATVISALGNAVGLFILGFAVAYGLDALLAGSAVLFTVLKFAGGLYLAWLGIRLIRNKAAFDLPEAGAERAKSPAALFLEALMVALTNPKAVLLLAALLPHFFAKGPEAVTVAILAATYAGLCFVNHILLGLLGGRLRRGLASSRLRGWLRGSLGASFIGFGGALAAMSR